MSFTPSVLVVDDEKRIRDVCSRMLSEEGFSVETADDGLAGLEMIESRHYDIILLDLMMPGLSGLEVLERVKVLHPDTVIVVITGYATLEHSIEAMKNGAFDFIPKPFSPQDLRMVVAKALEYIRKLQDISQEKSRMRTLISQMGDGVLATDADKIVALANPAFLKMIGHEGGDVVGMTADELVGDETLTAMIDQAVNMPPEEFYEITDELEGQGDKGDRIYGVRCVPFRDRAGRNIGTVTVLRDITTDKMIEKHKSDFVSMVAHEIRSPINSILMQIKIIQDGLAGDVTEKAVFHPGPFYQAAQSPGGSGHGTAGPGQDRSRAHFPGKGTTGCGGPAGRTGGIPPAAGRSQGPGPGHGRPGRPASGSGQPRQPGRGRFQPHYQCHQLHPGRRAD